MGLWLKKDGEFIPVSGGSGGGSGSGAKFISETVVVPANPGVSYSGIDVTFPEPFDAIPNITMTVQSGSAVYAEAANTTTTGFECIVRSTSALTRDAGNVSDMAINRDYSVWYQATDDSTISRFGGSGSGGDAGPHDHDYLPLTGGTVTGDLQVDGQVLAARGAADAPGLSFASFPGTGFYPGSTNVATHVNGVWQFVVYEDKTRVIRDLDVNQNLRVDGTIHAVGVKDNERDAPANVHINASGYLYKTTVGSLPLTGGTLTGGLTVAESLTLTSETSNPLMVVNTGGTRVGYFGVPGAQAAIDGELWLRSDKALILQGNDGVRVKQCDLQVEKQITANQGVNFGGNWSGSRIYGTPTAGREFLLIGDANVGGQIQVYGNNDSKQPGRVHVTGSLYVNDQPLGRFAVADGIDTADVLERAETATMPALDAEGVATTDVDGLTVNEVVTALLTEVKDLKARIEELEGN